MIAFLLLLVPAYALTAYVFLPASWHHARKRIRPRPCLVTYTAEGIPGDPVNIALIGTRAEVLEAMSAAGWSLADDINMRSGFRDARSVLFNRPYPSAPMSGQFLSGRRQDLAFEQAAGQSPRRRHHVRFWRVEWDGWPEGSVWIGAATFDRAMGVSSYTGEPMHHIDPHVDRERDKLLADLEGAGRIERLETVAGIGRSDRNGGGDRYETDGSVVVGVLR
jgi:LssY-like putative type I secretion system component LssY